MASDGCVAGGSELGCWSGCGERWGVAWWDPELHLSPINAVTVALCVCTVAALLYRAPVWRLRLTPRMLCLMKKSVWLSSGPFHFFFRHRRDSAAAAAFVIWWAAALSSHFIVLILRHHLFSFIFCCRPKEQRVRRKHCKKKHAWKKQLPGFSWGHSCGLNGFWLSLLRLEEAWGELRLFIGHISLPPEYEYVNLLLPITDHNCRRSRTFCRCSAWINKLYVLNVRRVKAFHHFPLLLLLFTEGPGKVLNLGTVLNEKKFSVQQTLGRLLWTFLGQVHKDSALIIAGHHPLLPKVLPGGRRNIPMPGSTFSVFGISAEPGHCTDSSVAALACPNSVHHLWGSP